MYLKFVDRENALIPYSDGSVKLVFEKDFFLKYRILSCQTKRSFFPSYPQANGGNFALTAEASQIMLNVIAGETRLSLGQREQLKQVAFALGYKEPMSQEGLFTPKEEFPFPSLDSEALYHHRDNLETQLKNGQELVPVNEEEVEVRELGVNVCRTKDGCAIVIKDDYRERKLVLHTYPLKEPAGPDIGIVGYTLFIKSMKEVKSQEFMAMGGEPDKRLVFSLLEEKLPKEVMLACQEALKKKGYDMKVPPTKQVSSQIPKVRSQREIKGSC